MVILDDIIYEWLISFWKPLPSDRPYQQRFYLIQSSAKFESPLIKRLPEVFQNILGKGAQRTDFINVSQFVCTMRINILQISCNGDFLYPM